MGAQALLTPIVCYWPLLILFGFVVVLSVRGNKIRETCRNMADDLRDELIRNTVRAHLREQNVKLWIPPYVDENGNSNVSVIEVCACSLSRPRPISQAPMCSFVVVLSNLSMVLRCYCPFYSP